MKRLLLIVLLFAPFSLRAQDFSNPLGGDLKVQDAGTCLTNKSFLWQHLPSNAGTTTINLSGTFSATVTVRESNNGGGSWSTAGTQTSVGTSSYSTSGFTDICADVTTFTSGVVSVSIVTGIGGGGGGGAGGLVKTTVSGLGAFATKGTVVSVTDGTSGTDCATGGSTNTVVCQYTGAAWTAVGGTGTGSVTSTSAGNLSPLFTSSVATPTSTPAITFSLSTAAANTVFGNFTGGVAAPTFTAAPTFSAANLTSFPTFNQNTTGSAAKWTTARLLANNSVDGSANVAFSNLFIVQGTTDAGLSGAQFLGALGTGILKNTTTTGVLSIAVAADLPGSGATTVNGQTCTLGATCTVPIQTNSVSNTSQAGVNFLPSTANSIGLTITPSNPSTNGEKLEATGIANATGGGSGLSNPTAHCFTLSEGASPFNLLCSPSTNGFYFCAYNVSGGIPVDATCNLAGVPVNAQAGNYPLVYTDRAGYIKESGTTTSTLTLPQVTGNTASNFPFVTQNLNSGNETITANAADKIDNGATGSSQTVLPNWAAWVYQDSSSAPGNWWTIRVPGFAAFGSTCGDATHALSWSTSTGFACQAITTSAAAGGSNTQLQYNNATALGGISGWTTNGTTTITAGSTSVLDLSAMAPASGLKIPSVAGAVPTADGFIGTNLTTHTHVWGSNGTTEVGAVAATGTGTATTCTNQFVSAVSSLVAPTCTTVTGAAMASNTVTGTQLAVVQATRTCDIGIGDTSGAVITNAQLGPQIKICQLPYAATISEIDVAADGGTPNVIVAKRHCTASPCVVGANETVSNLVSSALATASSGGTACSKTGATAGVDTFTTCSATLQNTSIAVGDFIELVSGTAGGVAKWMNIHVIYTVN